jgi:hypothetical protein
MPQGYYTIEEWKRPAWVVAQVLPFGMSLTAAEQALQRLGKPGFYRLVHTQRVIWAEPDGPGLRLRKSHASSPQNLAKMQEMFDRTGGRYPIEEAKAARRAAKQAGRPPKRGAKRK